MTDKNKLAQQLFEERKLLMAEKLGKIKENLEAGQSIPQAFGSVMFPYKRSV